MTGYINSIHVPYYLRSPLYKSFSTLYNVDTSDFIGKYEDYPTMVDFFTRPVKKREISPEINSLVSPADSKIMSVCEVTEDAIFLIKGKTYSYTELLTGKKEKLSEGFLDKLKSDVKNKIFSAIFYLSPGDYHRYHSPAD